ncbi:hypothetical protein ACWDRR_42490 [Kitasatospora sp. NPDC003701]
MNAPAALPDGVDRLLRAAAGPYEPLGGHARTVLDLLRHPNSVT